jgi:hypothetical protein
MKSIRIIFVSLFTLLLPIYSVAQDSTNPLPTGHIKGTAYDPNEAVIPGLKIRFGKVNDLEGFESSDEVEREVVTNKEGSYEIELPVGVYSLETESQGFIPFERADFLVLPNSMTMINIVPKPSSVPVGVLYVGPSDKAPRFPEDKKPETDEYTVMHPSGVPLEIRIEYAKKKERGGFNIYNNVVMSYNALIVYADKMSVDTKKKRGRMEAEGDVIVEDGKQRLKAKKVVVELDFDESGNLKYTVN